MRLDVAGHSDAGALDGDGFRVLRTRDLALAADLPGLASDGRRCAGVASAAFVHAASHGVR